MRNSERSANAVSGKTARACDSCVRRRARWYCAADDAFLCQACDSSVHSANPLARRHDRVRLKTSSSNSLLINLENDQHLPYWHRGYKRKARTPRKAASASARPVPLVPDLERFANEDEEEKEKVEEEEEQLLYRVPVFDPVLAEFCYPPPIGDTKEIQIQEEKPPAAKHLPPDYNHAASADGFAGFHLSDVDLADFAADVETLLGSGLDGQSFCVDGLGLQDARDQDEADHGLVKMELANDRTPAYQLDEMEMEVEMDVCRESVLDINFEDVEDLKKKVDDEETVVEADCGIGGRRIALRLDYDAVIDAWSCRGGSSPWTDGKPPQFNPDDFTEGIMWGGGGGGGGGEVEWRYGRGVEVGFGGYAWGGGCDSGREARVTRYREKRRTRLFSKKIRYEVRKLNAEKRPRMKGRFVKRASVFHTY